ncbi:MAG: PEP-CTERM sorting domain-containing protein [Stellaceae bacterium]
MTQTPFTIATKTDLDKARSRPRGRSDRTFAKRMVGAAALGVAAVLTMSAPAAQATPLTWDWTWSGTDTGSGMLTTNPESGGHYLITAMTGTWDGSTITGLDPPVPLINDNVLLPPPLQLNVFGLAFNIVGDEIGLYYNSAFGGYNAQDFNSGTIHLGTFQATIFASSAVPEPASIALFGTALIGLGLLGRRRSSTPRGA